jgi:hypothetical protein
MSGRLDDIAWARRIAQRTMRVVRQNLAWAVAYNAACVPLALAGWFPPWAAGLGMAASSLIVVLNAARLDPSRSPSATRHRDTMSFKTILVPPRCRRPLHGARVDLAIGLAAGARQPPRRPGPRPGLPNVLAVLGAYGRSRVREWVLGGTTRHLLDHMTVPTLMSH